MSSSKEGSDKIEFIKEFKTRLHRARVYGLISVEVYMKLLIELQEYCEWLEKPTDSVTRKNHR